MSRMTRARAAEVAERVHVDEDAVLETVADDDAIPPPLPIQAPDRPPLVDIEPNSGNSNGGRDTEVNLNKLAKGRKKTKKGAKDNKGNKGNNANALGARQADTPNAPVEVLSDDNESVSSSASKAASDDSGNLDPENKCSMSRCDSSWSHEANAGVREVVGMSHLPVHDIRPNSPPSKAVRLTRNQLRKSPQGLVPSEPTSTIAEKENPTAFTFDEQSATMANASPACGVSFPEPRKENISLPAVEPLQQTEEDKPLPPISETMSNTPQKNSSSSHPTSTKNMDSTTPEVLSDNLTIAALNSDVCYDELEAAAVEAQTPPRSSSMQAFDDSVPALDAMEEAVEKINAEVPEVQVSPQKVKAKKAPVVRTTKASQARISLAHGPKDAERRTSSWGKPPKAPSASLQSTSQRIPSASTDASGDEVPNKEFKIPHSKPRPISMSFPVPRPPPKSTKPPTKSTFQLPGEAVAAKLKAAKEARLQKEAEEQKQRAFKARPAPATTKTPTVRQTSTSKARQSLIIGKPQAHPQAHQRANSVATTRLAIGAKPETVKPNASGSSPNKVSVAPARAVKVTKRPSTAMAAMSRPRSALTSKPAMSAAPQQAASLKAPIRAASSMGAPAPTTTTGGTIKGKEVFNRASQAKSTAEKEKREKEEAAKKARAEAAERGRQASREWAEKQRLKKLGIKPENKQKENITPAEEHSDLLSEFSEDAAAMEV